MSKAWARGLIAVLVLWGAQAEAAAPAKKKVAVLDVHAIGAFDPKTVEGLSLVVTSEAGKFSGKVISGSDLRSLIGFERQKQLMGCSDSSCLAEIGGALGVDYLLSTDVAQVGDLWLISTTLLDVARATALKRVSRKADKIRDLVELAQQATGEALAAIPPPEGAPKASLEPRGDATATASIEAPMSGVRMVGIALDAVGAAGLLGGAIFGVVAHSHYTAAQSATNPADFQKAKDAFRTPALAANILYVAGGVVAATGIVLTIAGQRSETPSPAPAATVTLSPTPGGAAVLLSGGF